MANEDIDLNDTTTAYSVDVTQENAAVVLAAAEDLGVDPVYIRNYDGGFFGPKAVLHKAFPEVKKADDAKAAAEKKAAADAEKEAK